MAVPADRAGRADVRQKAGADVELHFFPFTAIVDQEQLKQALLLNAVNPAIGGVLIKGSSGTGKSTAVRGLAELLPEIEVVADCPFGCDPHGARCASCRARESLPTTRRPVRIVDLPLNATEDRVAGTIDIARALREGEKALEPGLLAEANRGILYIDEINLLDDHLTDVLLDAAALGVNVVEREGVSVTHPARFLLVGTMNPEEGELRPQIADRLGLDVDVEPVLDARLRGEIVRRREAFTADPAGFLAAYAGEQDALRVRVADAVERVVGIHVADYLYRAIGALAVRLGVESHRADVTVLQCAKALAALDGRDEVGEDDVLRAAGLALGHRLPVDPFAPTPQLAESDVRRALEEVLAVEVSQKKATSAETPPRV